MPKLRTLQDWSNRNGRPRFAVAHLQGALRRLDVRNPDEFVEAEYAVAAKDFVAAASDIASHCRYLRPSRYQHFLHMHPYPHHGSVPQEGQALCCST